jgi:hypothetical protein
LLIEKRSLISSSSETLKLKLLSCENLQGIDKDIAVVVYLIAAPCFHRYNFLRDWKSQNEYALFIIRTSGGVLLWHVILENPLVVH